MPVEGVPTKLGSSSKVFFFWCRYVKDKEQTTKVRVRKMTSQG